MALSFVGWRPKIAKTETQTVVICNLTSSSFGPELVAIATLSHRRCWLLTVRYFVDVHVYGFLCRYDELPIGNSLLLVQTCITIGQGLAGLAAARWLLTVASH